MQGAPSPPAQAGAPKQESPSPGAAAPAGCAQSTSLPGQQEQGDNAVKGIASGKKADGAKLINFYFSRLMEGDRILLREAQEALGPDFALPLICSSFSHHDRFRFTGDHWD